MNQKPTPQRRATDHPEVVEEIRKANGHHTRPRRQWLVYLAVATAAFIVAVFFARAIEGERRDLELCRDMDRFALAIIMSIETDKDRTPSERTAALAFMERFRDDLDCRTAPEHE